MMALDTFEVLKFLKFLEVAEIVEVLDAFEISVKVMKQRKIILIDQIKSN